MQLSLFAEEMPLQQLRQSCKPTQQKVAKSLRIGQEGVSKIGKRSDLLISTLRDFVQAMGGQLSPVVEFPDQKPVILSGIAEFCARFQTRSQARSRNDVKWKT